MGLLSRIDYQLRNEGGTATYNDRDGWFADWLRGDVENDSGVTISESTAMKTAMVWKCVNWRAKMFGMLPKKLYERVELMGRPAQREARNHPLYSLIHSAPNPTMTSAAWFGLISADVHLYGNSYAYIEKFRNTNRIVGLWRIMPDSIRIEQNKQTGELWYVIGYGDGREQRFYPDEILHIRGLGFDGIRGYSAIQMQKQALGWAKATRQFSSRYYKNAFRPSGLLIAPATIKDKKAKDELVANIKAAGKEGGLALIEGALEYKPMLIPQDDAQFLETVQLQDEDICGIMEVKPHKVGIMRHMTNNNVEQQNIEAVTDTLQPFTVSVEQWMDLQLLSDLPSSGRGGGTERDRFFTQCELKVLLRGDTAAQTSHIEKMIDKGVYSANDARDYLGSSPYAGGDRYWMNAAYNPIDRIDELLDKKSAPAPTPVAPPDKGKQQAMTTTVLGVFFRDAIGRVVRRTPKERAKTAHITLKACVLACAELNHKDDAFVEDYVNAMSLRSSIWSEPLLDSIVTEEVDRALTAFQS